jgi:hypothetical protein
LVRKARLDLADLVDLAALAGELEALDLKEKLAALELLVGLAVLEV